MISSAAGSIALGPGVSTLNAAYTISKAAVNYLARKVYCENEDLDEWRYALYSPDAG